MGKKKEVSENVQVVKIAKVVEVKVVVPWVIVAVMAAAGAGLISGWFIHVEAVASASQAIAQLK